MGEAIRHHAAGRHLLQPVVADRGGGAQSFFHIAGIELDLARGRPPRLRGVVSPDSGEAVGLKFQRNRRAVLSRPAIAGGALIQPEQVLHVMTELVRNHIGLREVARRAQLLRQLVEEPEIEVDHAVLRTVERAGRRLSEPARRLNRVAEQPHLGALIPRTELLGPHVLRVLRHRPDFVNQPFFSRRAGDLSRASDRLGRRRRVAGTEQREQVGAAHPAQQQQDKEAANPKVGNPEPSRSSPRVVDVASIAW